MYIHNHLTFKESDEQAFNAFLNFYCTLE
jgi:hypothetical protein